MGQEQSTPNSRRGLNKLSKPRTNSFGNVLNTVVPEDSSRERSRSSDLPRKSRYNLFTSEGHGEHGEHGKGKRPKRRSIFRSRSSQARHRIQLDPPPQTSMDNFEPAPVEAPVRRYSVVNYSTPAHSEPDLAMQRYLANIRLQIDS
jgi:hypothetical protein